MRSHDIENWALDVIDRVKAGQPIEDSRVELKAQWPEDARKTARQIAGHANAARGEIILWLIGVDEKAGTITGVDFNEFSSWYNSVKARFDEFAPEPISLHVPAEGVTVAALCFETDRAPYVVKNSEGGLVQREVPWREATGVRSATRAQLLRLLAPLQKLPKMEIPGCLLKVHSEQNQKGESMVHWDISLAVFLIQPPDQHTVIASHRCKLIVNISESETLGTKWWIHFRGTGIENVSTTEKTVCIRGSGLFEVRCIIASKQKKEGQSYLGKDAHIEFSFLDTNDERRVMAELTLKGQTKKSNWQVGNYTFRK